MDFDADWSKLKSSYASNMHGFMVIWWLLFLLLWYNLIFMLHLATLSV